MKLLPSMADREWTSVSMLAGMIVVLTMWLPAAGAQAPATGSKPAESQPVPETVETIYIVNASAQNDLNDVQTALRNMVPRAKIYATPTQNAITIRASAEDMELAKKMITDLDRPRKAYRVTYTITDLDGGKRVGTNSLTLLVVEGGKTTIKHGSRVPIVTGMADKAIPAQSSQVQYLDVGLNIDASIDGERLRSKIEQSSVAEEKSGIGVQDPVVHQTTVEGISNLDAGKPVVLGSLDIPGTARRQEIAALAELIK